MLKNEPPEGLKALSTAVVAVRKAAKFGINPAERKKTQSFGAAP